MDANELDTDKDVPGLVSLRAAHKLLHDLDQELRSELSLVLKADLQDDSKEIGTEIYSQAERRILVRSIFSYIEAISYATKALVLSDPDSSKLTAGERMLASEITYELGSTGEVSVRAAKIPLTANIRFTRKIFSKVFGNRTPLDTAGQDWERFQRSIKVRDRITHPKQSTDLVITDEELVEAVHALNWFNRSNTIAMIEWATVSNAKICILEQALQKITKMKEWNNLPADVRSRIGKLLEQKADVQEEPNLDRDSTNERAL